MIVPVAFVDSSQATASYVKQFRARLVKSEGGEFDRIVLLANGKDGPILSEWKSARILIEKIRNISAPLFDGHPAEIDGAVIASLPPKAHVDWRTVNGDGLLAYLPLLPSPGAMLFSGMAAMNPPVGQLVAVSRGVPFSAINMGEVAAVWLVLSGHAPVRMGEPAKPLN